jgi:hypothetical protein
VAHAFLLLGDERRGLHSALSTTVIRTSPGRRTLRFGTSMLDKSTCVYLFTTPTLTTQ